MPTRPILLPDLDAELTTAMIHIEEVLRAIADREDDPDDGPARLPAPLADQAALRALHRLWDAIAPTQGDHARKAGNHQTIYAPDGRYEHIPLRVARVNQVDIHTMTAAARFLNDHAVDWCVHESLDQIASMYDYRNAKELASTAARFTALLDMRPHDPDSHALIRVLSAARRRAQRIVLTPAEETAYQRVTREMNRRWTGGGVIAAWAY